MYKRTNKRFHPIARASVEISATQRKGRALRRAAVVLAAVAGVAYLASEPLHALLMSEQVRTLSVRSEEAGSEIKRLTMELAHERATRAAVEAQLEAVTEELKRNRKELLFYKESSSRTGR